jgi:HK97 family phage major capsid protein
MSGTGTDVLIAQYQSELEERQSFIDQIVGGAEGRDLNSSEMEMLTKAGDRMAQLNTLVGPLREMGRIAVESRNRMAEIQRDVSVARNPASVREQVEYRSAGAYLVDYWRAGVGHEDARERLNLYTRAAAHQTTGDNLGIIPEPVVGPVLVYIDSARPLVSALGPKAVPGGRFTRPRITQHTLVGPQAGEKTELLSRKMLITDVQVLMSTYGGYVNVSRQNIDWSSPNIMDIVVQDLAAQYAIETEEATADLLTTNSVAGPVLPTGPTTGDAVAAAIWTAAASAYNAMQGTGSLILAVSPDMLGLVGPLFAPYNPSNTQGGGFSAGSFGQGAMGAISGITVVMSAALDPGTMLVLNTAAAEVYEQRVGALSVTEPSVLGVQVAYAGYFAPIVLESAGVIKITKTP